MKNFTWEISISNFSHTQKKGNTYTIRAVIQQRFKTKAVKVYLSINQTRNMIYLDSFSDFSHFCDSMTTKHKLSTPAVN